VVIVIGDGPEALRLESTAMARFAVNKTVMRFSPTRLAAEDLPEALAELLPNVSTFDGAPAMALVCRGRTCLPPIVDAEALLEALEGSDH